MRMMKMMENQFPSSILWSLLLLKTVVCGDLDSKNDFVQPNEKHYTGIPTFLQEPLPIYYVNKTWPAQITCVAEPVSHVNIFCAEKQFSYMGEEMSDSGLHVIKLNNLNKPDTSGKRWKFSLVVKFKDVLEWFSEYKCYCEAWNQIIAINKAKKVHSGVALIQESYFQNEFKKIPESQTIEEGGRLIMLCIPPDAKPNAKITWFKNNYLITENKAPSIFADQFTQLIIERVQMNDDGNYSCVAQSLGIRRQTEPAVITVTKNYHWSQWMDWVPCPEQCVIQKSCFDEICARSLRKRMRFCLLNGVKTNTEKCKDEETESEACDIGCEPSSNLKSWTEWSITCSPNCSESRMRRCEIIECKGIQMEARNCSQKLCEIKAMGYQSTTMYLGLFVIIALLFAVILFILCLVTRKGYIRLLPQRRMELPSPNHGNIKYYGNKISKSQKLLIDAEEKCTVVTIQNHSTQHPSGARTTLNDDSTEYSPVYDVYRQDNRSQVVQEIYSEYPILSKPSFPHQTKAPLKINGISKDRSYHGDVPWMSELGVEISRPSSGLYHDLSINIGSCGMLSKYLPSNIGPDTVVWGTISSSGGRLSLPQSGICLTIPMNAIQNDNSEEMFLAVCRCQHVMPTLNDSEILLSPVILCGPPNVSLLKAAILTIPHCANSNSTYWRIRILNASYKKDLVLPSWKELSTIRPVNISDTEIYSQLDPQSTCILTNQLQMMCIIGYVAPAPDSSVSIRLRLMAFSTELCSEDIQAIRIHIIPDTKEAVENVVLAELGIHGQLLNSSKKMSFSSSGDDIAIHLDDLSVGWKCQGKFQVVSRFQICRLNHSQSYEVRFLLNRVDPSKIGFTCNISAQQANEPNSCIMFNIVKENGRNESRSIITASLQFDGINSEFSQTYLDPLETFFRLSTAIRKQLWPLLDPCWQTLANHMDLNGNTKYFECKNSPADVLLDLWEARCLEEDAVQNLIKILHTIGRSDCAILIEKDIVK